MINWMYYSKIQELKSDGFNKSQAQRRLGIDYKTILKYWDMSPDDYSAECGNASSRLKKADVYKDYIVSVLQQNPDMTTAQLYDWIKEKSGKADLCFSERTLRNYATAIRKEYDIAKPSNDRVYEAVEELPMGYQAQVDMGSTNQKTVSGRSKKLYCFAMVLSHSRYKYVLWQDHPFTSMDFVAAHVKAFQFFGGRPKELVYDQDRVMVVSENNGDIIYTESFQNYLNQEKFKIFLCHGADPESKGKVENVVKYVKHNFAEHRIFCDIESFNQDCIAWLKRTGNATEHGTTKKIPAEVFSLEKEYLKPVCEYTFVNSDKKSISYNVRIDNIVLYKSNRYRVPAGTYTKGKKVLISVHEDNLTIIDADTNLPLITHKLCHEKGKTVGERNKHEEKTSSTIELENKVIELFAGTARIADYLEQIRIEHPRHYKQQLYQIKKLFDEYAFDDIVKGLDYCILHGLYSYGDLQSGIIYVSKVEIQQINRSKLIAPQLPEKYRGNNPAVRDLNVYEKALGGLR